MPTIYAKGRRLILRNPRKEDAAALRHLLNPNRDIEAWESRINSWLESSEAGKNAFCVLEAPSLTHNDKSQSMGNIIGQAGFNALFTHPDGTKVGDIGLLIDPTEWRKGYGTEALKLMFDVAFKDLGLDFVEAQTDVENKGMRKVMEKMGFRGMEQRREGQAVEREGEGAEVCYNVGREEWLQRKK